MTTNGVRRRQEPLLVGGAVAAAQRVALAASSNTDAKAGPILHAKAVHVEAIASPFSKESSEQNYRGFINLGLLFLGANMVRLVIENYVKYGILLSIPGRHVPLKDLGYFALMTSQLCAHLVIVFFVERLALNRQMGPFIKAIAFLNISLLLSVAPWIIWRHMYHPCISGLVLCCILVFAMKMVSFHASNAELRHAHFHSEPEAYPECPYPSNLSVGNFLYFLAAPTLCYQPVYPRIPRVRKSFLAKRLFELASASVMIYIIIEQFATPTVKNSMASLETLNPLGILERLLKLSFSSLYVWLLGFYAIFHSFFNLTAELLRFGDRSFYHCWWNANALDEYWRLWNAPVHIWLKRHIYCPMRAKGYSPGTSQLVIFALSAFFHEYLVSVPTHTVQAWAFGAMLFQVPLIFMTRWYMHRFPGSSAGNYFFWITLCIFGQPMCVLLYYRAWIKSHP